MARYWVWNRQRVSGNLNASRRMRFSAVSIFPGEVLERIIYSWSINASYSTIARGHPSDVQLTVGLLWVKTNFPGDTDIDPDSNHAGNNWLYVHRSTLRQLTPGDGTINDRSIFGWEVSQPPVDLRVRKSNGPGLAPSLVMISAPLPMLVNREWSATGYVQTLISRSTPWDPPDG